MINLFKNKYFFSLIIIFIPFLSFLNVNLQSFDNIFFISVFFILSFVIILNLLTSFLLSKLIKKISYKTLFLFFSFTFFVLFYLFQFFKDLLIFVAPIYSAEISIILSIVILFLLFIVFLNNTIILLKRFVLIYVFIIFGLNLGIFGFNSKIFFSSNESTDPLVFVNNEGIDYLNNYEKTNIYFVIVDAAIPLGKFDNQYKTNYSSDYLSELNDKGFEYIKNTKAAYPNTTHSLTSLFFLDYHINEKNYEKYPLTNLFPRILQKANIQRLALIKNLDKMNYKFRWLGNTYNDCRHNTDLCLNNDDIKKRNYCPTYFKSIFTKKSVITDIYKK